jgi:anti-sigma factor RsiW
VKPDLMRDATYHRAPQALRERVSAGVAAAADGERTPRWSAGLFLAASFATVALLAWNMALWTMAPASDDAIARDVVAAHVRSLMAPGRLADVVSSDRHAVKPWFAGKLDFAPPVRDLSSSGFPLTGGRLDYIDGRPVAALTYARRLHTVNLFVWPSPGVADTAPLTSTRSGYTVTRWTRGEMRHWAVSDASREELEAFASAMNDKGS